MYGNLFEILNNSPKFSTEETKCIEEYVKLGEMLRESLLSVDVLMLTEPLGCGSPAFVCPNYNLLSDLCGLTGGQLLMMSGDFSSADGMERLSLQLHQQHEKYIGYEVAMKLRCSLGYSNDKILGNGVFNAIMGTSFQPVPVQYHFV